MLTYISDTGVKDRKILFLWRVASGPYQRLREPQVCSRTRDIIEKDSEIGLGTLSNEVTLPRKQSLCDGEKNLLKYISDNSCHSTGTFWSVSLPGLD